MQDANKTKAQLIEELTELRRKFNSLAAGSPIQDSAGHLQERLVPVNLKQVIEVAINMAFNEIKYRARLVKEYGKVSAITANDGRLSQVFLTLLINAAHAIPEGNNEENEIRVRTWQEGNEVCAEVRDTGKGISAQHLPHLFEPSLTTKEIGVGTGLDLSIIRNIVESFGGRIEVTSAVGEGTSFVVHLHGRTAEASDDAAQKAVVPAKPEARGRILVIDDEPEIRSAIARMLRGSQVVEAGSGEDARKILETDQAFDLILCDMMMPIMSGVDLHEWLLAAHPELADQVVFITGGAFTPKSREYLTKVGNILIEKPFDVANFKKIVSELILANRTKSRLGEPKR
jgi:CheY-like chemotaxis protein